MANKSRDLIFSQTDKTFLNYLRKKLPITFNGGGGGGNSVPSGGLQGQVLGKNSNASGDYGWITIPTPPQGGLTNQVLKKASNADYDFVWADDEGEDTQYVNTYADLPDPTTVPNTTWGVLTSTGSPYISAILGGNYRAKGFYYSDGTQWIYLGEFPIQASNSEVQGGTVSDKFVAPDTLKRNYFFNGGNTVLADAILGTLNGYDLVFKVNNIERARLTTLGVLNLNSYLGIGTATPISPLHIVGADEMITLGEEDGATGKMLVIGYNMVNNYAFIQSVHQGSAYRPLVLNGNGGPVLIGTSTNSGEELQVSGTAKITDLITSRGGDVTIAKSGSRELRPTVGAYVGDVFYQTDELFGLYYWDGTEWINLDDQFVSANWRLGANINGFATTTSNGGSTVGTTGTTWGGIAIRTGTSVNGRAGIIAQASWRPNVNSELVLEMSIYIPTEIAGNGVDDCTVYLGCANNADRPTGGPFFQYRPDINNGNWVCCSTRDGVTYSEVNTSIPFGLTNSQTQRFVIHQYKDKWVQFWIDGVKVATISGADVENAASQFGGAMIVKTAGSTVSHSMYLRSYTTKIKTNF